MCVAEYTKTVDIRKAEFLAVVEETEAEGKKEGWQRERGACFTVIQAQRCRRYFDGKCQSGSDAAANDTDDKKKGGGGE